MVGTLDTEFSRGVALPNPPIWFGVWTEGYGYDAVSFFLCEHGISKVSLPLFSSATDEIRDFSISL